MELTQEIVRELLDYDPDTGVLTWKERPLKYFEHLKRGAEWESKRWNNSNAANEAFTAFMRGYRRGTILGKYYLAHRIIWLWMTGEWPDNIDHINGSRSDNRWVNLRSVTIAENNRNFSISKANSTGTTGIYLSQSKKGYYAQIRYNGEKIHLGTFKTKEEAIKARKDADKQYFYHENHGKTS